MVNVCLREDNHSYMHSRILYKCPRLSILCYVMFWEEWESQWVNVCLPEDNHSYMHSRILYTCHRLSILCYVMVRMGESMVNVCLPEDNHSYMHS